MKGVHLAIDAVAKANQQGADVRFSIVGEGPVLGALQQQVQEAGLGKRVQFLGWMNQADLFAQYRAHDVLLFPSLHDSSGNVVLEAMAHGLPVVCLKAGGPAMMVDTANGYVIDPSGHDAPAVVDHLAQALAELAADAGAWQQLSEGALARARATSWMATTAATYRLLPVPASFRS